MWICCQRSDRLNIYDRNAKWKKIKIYVLEKKYFPSPLEAIEGGEARSIKVEAISQSDVFHFNKNHA